MDKVTLNKLIKINEDICKTLKSNYAQEFKDSNYTDFYCGGHYIDESFNKLFKYFDVYKILKEFEGEELWQIYLQSKLNDKIYHNIIPLAGNKILVVYTNYTDKDVKILNIDEVRKLIEDKIL